MYGIEMNCLSDDFDEQFASRRAQKPAFPTMQPFPKPFLDMVETCLLIPAK